MSIGNFPEIMSRRILVVSRGNLNREMGRKLGARRSVGPQDYHKQMLALRQKVSPREVVIGWFSTGDQSALVGDD